VNGRLGKKRSTVPYVTLRRDEEDYSEEQLVWQQYKGAGRLAYRDEQDGVDRDYRGILYARVSESLDASGWPTGLPDWELVHPRRQRKCIEEFFCPVCRCEVDDSVTADGPLFVQAVNPHQRAEPAWPEGWVTCQPPVCVQHAANAPGLGPHIPPSDRVALRARTVRWAGLLGTPYRRNPSAPDQVQRAPTPDGTGEVLLPFDDPRIPHVLGLQLALVLRDVTVVDLDAETAANNEGPTQWKPRP
jgi:hypothetical protein